MWPMGGLGVHSWSADFWTVDLAGILLLFGEATRVWELLVGRLFGSMLGCGVDVERVPGFEGWNLEVVDGECHGLIECVGYQVIIALVRQDR